MTPSSKRSSPSRAIQLAVLLAAGAAIRFLLLPLTFHGDILFIQHLPMLLLKGSEAEIYGTWGRYFLERDGAMYYPPLVMYLTAALQGAASAAFHGLPGILMDYHELLMASSRVRVDEFLAGYSISERMAFASGTKAGYLVFDFLGLFLFSRIFSEAEGRGGAAIQSRWIFNPVLIFSTYMMGQYRILSLFFAVLMLLAFRRGRETWAFVCLGCLCLMENYPWLLAPLYLMIHTQGSAGSLFKTGGVLALFLTLTLGVLALSSNGYVLYAYASPVIMQTALSGVLRSAGVWGGIAAKVLLAGTGLFLFILLWGLRLRGRLDSEARWKLMLDVSISLLLVLYATSAVSIHYFMWILPFWLCRHILGVPWPAPFSVLLIFLLFFFNMDSRFLNLGFLMPLDPVYWVSMPSLHEMMEKFLPWGKVIGSARLLFSILCAYFVFILMRPYFLSAFNLNRTEPA